MEKEKLTLVKVGGGVVEERDSLARLLDEFSKIEGKKLLVHGGGRSATALATRLGIESKMVDGRRITDAETLKVVTMVYAGWVNKQIVAGLQARGVNALGLCGVDMDAIRSEKRPVKDIDYGFVGDVKKVRGEELSTLISTKIVPIIAPITHDGKGNLLNTNADTIASEVAKGLVPFFDVSLVFSFEKAGVLEKGASDESVVSVLSLKEMGRMKENDVISGGMIPKIENAFEALHAGVKEVFITHWSDLKGERGTKIVL